LAYGQRFLGSFEIGPTEQVFLLNRYPDLEIGLTIEKDVTVATSNSKPKTTSAN